MANLLSPIYRQLLKLLFTGTIEEGLSFMTEKGLDKNSVTPLLQPIDF